MMNTEISNELNELGEDLQKFDAKCEKAKGNEDLLLDLLLEPRPNTCLLYTSPSPRD